MTTKQKTLLEDLHNSRNEKWDVELYKKTLVETFQLSEDEAMSVLREFAAYQTKKAGREGKSIKRASVRRVQGN